jgi:phospholipid/cholesterol/gamma-HCH transport system substrate-binding protein
VSVTARWLLGATVLLAAVAAVWLAWSKPDPFGSRETVHALFDDAGGLAPVGADVRVAGVPVGKVTGITRGPPPALVPRSIDSSVGIVHRDARAALRPRLMFEGTAYVQLTLGSPTAPALGDAQLPPSQTSTYVPFADVLSVLDARGRGEIRSLARTAGALASGPAPAELHDALGAAPGLTADAATIARAAQGTDGTELAQAVTSLAGVSTAVASRAPALGALLGSTARTAAAAQVDAGAPLGQALSGLPATVASLKTGADAAGAIATRAGTLVSALAPSAAQLRPTIDLIRPLLRSAGPVLTRFQPVLGDALTAVRGAARGAAPALGAIDALTPTLDIFRDTLLTALEQKTDLGDPAYLAFLGLFAGGGGASRPFGVDGAGHFMRFGLRFLTGIGLPLPSCSLLEQAAPPLAKLLSSVGTCTP